MSAPILSLDIITGLAGSGRCALADSMHKQQVNSFIVQAKTSIAPKERFPASAQALTRKLFKQQVIPALTQGRNVIFVTPLCEEEQNAYGLAQEMQTAIQTSVCQRVLMNCIHIQPASVGTCLTNLFARKNGEGYVRIHFASLGGLYNQYRKHGPFYSAYPPMNCETVTLSPLDPMANTTADMVDTLCVAKAETPTPRLSLFGAAKEPFGIVIEPTPAETRSANRMKPASTPQTSLHC